MNIKKKATPSQILLRSFLIIIFLGTIILLLPLSSAHENKNISFISALFTSVSAVTVTGLSIVDINSSFSLFGKTTIMVLFQLGGLGIMTFSSIIMSLLKKRISYRDKSIVKEDLNLEAVGGTVRFIKRLILLVFSIEIIGAMILYFSFKDIYSTSTAIYYSIFHSISAFCNAGFSLFSDSFSGFSGNYVINFTISSLIILGGIGFAVMNTTLEKIRGNKKIKYSLTSKLSIRISIILLIVGVVVIFFSELQNPATMANLSIKDKLLTSYFQSVTTRTAGFNTISIADLQPASILLFLVFMFIGASPGSTGGGIKTTTIGVIFFSIWATLRNKPQTNIGNRSISTNMLKKAFAVFFISLTYILIVSFIILFIENKNFTQIIFEVISAFSTVGLSMGITSSLSIVSKLIIIITMFIGRVGPLTVALAFGEQLKTVRHELPGENILVG